MDAVDCIVVGAGVVGLAVARELAIAGHETLILDRNDAIGTETSSRNSEVVHAGIHYPYGSLKARLCVHGRDLLYEYCMLHGIEHRRCGKLIVATADDQLPDLERIATAARRNGVKDLVFLDQRDAGGLEPALTCVAALLSPSTGIVDTHGLMLSMLGDAEQHGALLALNSPVAGIVASGDGFAPLIATESAPAVRARWIVNCAGLGAVSLARTIVDFPAQHVPREYFAKGNYFSLTHRSPFSRLVYPVPEPGGLGVHLTLDLAGQARFGPDVEWVNADFDYTVNPRRADSFYDRIRKYWPALEDGTLAPAYSGVRPKISGPGEPAADFRIDGPDQHGVPGLVNLFGIESPGLTASLAIAEVVASIVNGR